jgi:imidazolonepropionase-like amidohydrolase
LTALAITLAPWLAAHADTVVVSADRIEHASLADDEAFQLAKQHGAWFSMAIYNDDDILAEGEKNGVFKESLEKEKMIGLKQRKTFQAAVKAGVKMVYGTDGGVYPNGDNAKQFAAMVTWGMTPLQAIQSATLNAAEALGKSGDLGSIALGRFGDLVGVSGNPLVDVKLLEKISFVMKSGELVRAPGSQRP